MYPGGIQKEHWSGIHQINSIAHKSRVTVVQRSNFRIFSKISQETSLLM